jgi:hypothetical protein
VFHRYTFYPRYDEPDGVAIFPVCTREEDPAIIHFIRYTSALYTYLKNVIHTLNETRHALDSLKITRATEINDPALATPPPPPPHLPVTTDESPPRFLPVNLPRTILTPRRTSTEMANRTNTKPSAQCRRLDEGPHSPDSIVSLSTAPRENHVGTLANGVVPSTYLPPREG